MTSCEKQLLAPDADVVKGYGTLEDVICSNPHQGLAFKRPTIHEGWYHYHVSRDKVPTKFTSKTPGESLGLLAIKRLLQWKLKLVEKLVTAKFSTKSSFCRAKEQQISRRNFLNCLLNRKFLLNRCLLNRCTTVLSI